MMPTHLQLPTAPPALPARRAAAAIGLPTAALLWLPAVLLTLVAAPAPAILAAAVAAAAVCVAAQVARPASIVVTLPFFALLSPVTGLLNVGVGQVVLSDLLFALLAVQAVLIASSAQRGHRRRLPFALGLLGIVFALGVLAGSAAGYLVSLKSMLYLAQLAIVAFFTARHVSRDTDWLVVQRAWIVASIFGATILLQAYGEGRNLDTLKEGDQAPLSSPDDLLSLFRATYYYTGFHFVLGLCLVWAGTRLFFPAPRIQRLVLLAAMALLIAALVVSVNKTAMAAGAVALVLTALVLFVRFRREMARAMARLGALVALAVLVTSWQYAQLAENTQIDLIVDRLLSASSLLIRFEVYVSAISEWLSSPWTVLLGYGADFLGSGNPVYAVPLKTSATTGYVEGTVDSGWLSYLVELGLAGALVLLALFARGLARAVRGVRRAPCFDESAYAQACVFGGLVFLAIAMTTQMLGYSKTSWLPLQLLVVAAMGLRRVPSRGA